MCPHDEPPAVTRRLCGFVVETDFDEIPGPVVNLATRMLIDTVGVTLAASITETVAKARRALPESTGGARVVGATGAGSVRDASLLTGVGAHALDFDDVHHSMGGHPTAPVLAAALPVAADEGLTGAELLTAIVLGTEVEITLANILNPGHYERGWHPTSVLGTFGAVTAAGKLLDLDREQLRHAFGVAASAASGIKGNFGTMTKPYHVGNTSRSGVEAAALAAQGFTANERILEVEFGGVLDLFKGDSGVVYADHLERLGSPWKITAPRTTFKPYPCCGSTHAAVDAALSLRDGVEPASISRVEIVEHPRRLGHTNRPAPETGLDAKFSVQYCVSTALLDGDLWIDHFSEDALRRVDVESLLQRVTVTGDEERFETVEWGAAVSVETDDGDRVSTTVDAPRGSESNPMSDDEFDQKYRRCASRALDNQGVEASLERLRKVETVSDVDSVMAVLIPE